MIIDEGRRSRGPIMSVLIERVMCGWLEMKVDLPIKLTRYFHTLDEYTIQIICIRA